MRTPSAVLLLAAPLLALGPPRALAPRAAPRPAADELAFHPKADTKVKKELEVALDLKPEKIVFTVNGESMPPENLGGVGEQSIHLKLAESVTDEFVLARDGRPTDLRRTFDDVSASYEVGDEKGRAEGADALQGKTVRFHWNPETETYERTYYESEGDEKLLENLSDDMDLRLLLPGKKVADGDTWEVSGEGLLPLFLPGGLPGEIDASDEEAFAAALQELEAAFSDVLEDLRVQCRYHGSRDDDGERVGEISLSFTSRTSLDLSELVQRLSEMEDDEVQPEVTATATLDLQGEGTLLWDLAAGHARSFKMQCETGLDLDVKATADVEGETFEMAIQGRLDGKATWSLAVSKP